MPAKPSGPFRSFRNFRLRVIATEKAPETKHDENPKQKSSQLELIGSRKFKKLNDIMDDPSKLRTLECAEAARLTA